MDFGLSTIPSSMYVVHATEVKRSATHRNLMYTFGDTHSWLDVALQVLLMVGWRPECSQAQTRNCRRRIPPVEQLSHFPTNKELPTTDKYVAHEGAQRLLPRITLTSGVVRIAEVLATVVALMTDNRALFSSGFIHGQLQGATVPTYMQEATLLHALRVVREWVLDTNQVQDHIHHIHIRAGSALVHYQVSKW